MDDRIKFRRKEGRFDVEGWVEEESPEGFKVFVPDAYRSYSTFVPKDEVVEIIRGLHL